MAKEADAVASHAEFETPSFGSDEQVDVPGPTTAAPDPMLQELLNIPGVVGADLGTPGDGRGTVLVFMTDASISSKLPHTVYGRPVEAIIVPGGFRPQSE
jgi:hypothetical protein